MSARCCSTRRGRVFVARRADLPNAEGAPGGWQLPQGGIDAGEDPAAAVLRELAEEIGTDRAEIIGEHPDWLTYDLPDDAAGRGAARALPRPAAALVRAALPRRATPTSGWTPTRIPSSTPGAGRSWPSCRRWRWTSSGRSTRSLRRRSPASRGLRSEARRQQRECHDAPVCCRRVAAALIAAGPARRSPARRRASARWTPPSG